MLNYNIGTCLLGCTFIAGDWQVYMW